MLFSLDYQVSVRQRGGGVLRYTLLENQGGYLVVMAPEAVPVLSALMRTPRAYDLDLLVHLADYAQVLDRQSGQVLSQERATEILAASQHGVLQAAAVYRTPLETRWRELDGQDLAWAFSLVCARRGIQRPARMGRD